jgi:hypothetical protein
LEPDPPARFVPTAERPIREGPTPFVTLVVLVSRPGDALEEILDFAVAQADAGRGQVLAVHRGDTPPGYGSERRAGVRWIAAGSRATETELRERGLSEADGDVVKFLDPRIPAGWA